MAKKWPNISQNYKKIAKKAALIMGRKRFLLRQVADQGIDGITMSKALESIHTVLSFHREFPSIECKAAFNLDTDKWMLGKTLRAMMGMANLQGGGVVIIGISENKSNLRREFPTHQSVSSAY